MNLTDQDNPIDEMSRIEAQIEKLAATEYLLDADPEVQSNTEIGRRKVELCRRFGLTGLYPLDNVDRNAPDVSLQIFRANQAMMEFSDAIMANLTFFEACLRLTSEQFRTGLKAAET